VLQDVHLPTLVRDTATLIRASLAKATTIDLHGPEALPRINGDASQLQQVVMNLAINASEAMPDSGGVVRIETRCDRPGRRDDETEVVVASQPDVDHVSVEVTDTGVGIDRGLHRRIFEPFFTTKFTGRGLGLAAVQGIVRGHGGAMYLASRPGHGTRFRVLFPALATIGPVPEPRDEPPTPAVGSAEVLVVDDEEVVRVALARILKRYGYACLAVGGGAAAIAAVAAAPGRFRLALLDLTMPDPDGVAVFAALRTIAPDLRVLLMSGYTEAEVDSRFGDAKPDGFMQKPVGAPAVLRAVRAILGQA
jgi:CheY-like chemotaxis protein